MFRPHAHEGYAIGIIEQGAQSVRLGGSRQIFATGTLALINPGEVHTGQAQTERGWTYRMLYPPVGTVLAALEGQPQPVFRSASVNDPALYRRFLALYRALEQGGEALELNGRWRAFLTALTERHAEQGHRPVPVHREPGAVRRAQQILQACAAHGTALTLSDLAEQAGLPLLHLLRAFKAATGLPRTRIRRSSVWTVRATCSPLACLPPRWRSWWASTTRAIWDAIFGKPTASRRGSTRQPPGARWQERPSRQPVPCGTLVA